MNGRLLRLQLQYWKLALQGKTLDKALRILTSLRGHVRNVAVAAAMSLWSKEALSQAPIYFGTAPLSAVNLEEGQHAFLDADLDGDSDILTLHNGVFKLSLNETTTNGYTFGTAQAEPMGLAGVMADLFGVGDMDNDGFQDLVISIDGQLYFLKNSGNTAGMQEFLAPVAHDFGILNEYFTGDFTIYDFDSDGDDDIAGEMVYDVFNWPCTGMNWYYTYGYYNSYRKNLGVPGELLFDNLNFNSVNWPVFDINDDGLHDMLTASSIEYINSDGVSVPKQLKLGGEAGYQYVGLPHGTDTQGIIADIDSDGDNDVITNSGILFRNIHTPPSCTDIIEPHNLSCLQFQPHDYYCWTELSVLYNSNLCLDYPDSLGHFVHINQLKDVFVGGQQSDIFRGAKITTSPIGGEEMYRHTISRYTYECENMGPYIDVSTVPTFAGSIFNDYPGYDFYPAPTWRTISQGLFIRTLAFTSFQFQVSDGLAWSEPCTYTIFVAEDPTNAVHDISASPNPAKDEVILSYNGVAPEHKTWRLTDASGWQIMTGETYHVAWPIHLQNLPNGLYFVHVNDDNGNYGVVKVIIER